MTLTSTTKVYSPEDYGKVNYNPKVKFQVKSGASGRPSRPSPPRRERRRSR
ncbi:hypothetical protein IOD13_18805 [Brevibacterium casei]|nr:hypothetical protein [Brevibacterium casei]